jgi:hypothetical protein
MKHHPMTGEQRAILDQDLATVMKTLSDIANLLNACYGDADTADGASGRASGSWAAASLGNVEGRYELDE